MGTRDRIAAVLYWQRQVMNARGALRAAWDRNDVALARVMSAEMDRAEVQRDAAISMLGVSAGADFAVSGAGESL